MAVGWTVGMVAAWHFIMNCNVRVTLCSSGADKLPPEKDKVTVVSNSMTMRVTVGVAIN